MLAFLANSWLSLLLSAAAAYLLGSLNWAIIITWAVGHKDIRTEGSGNAGATNVLRSQGVFPAVLTMAGDIGKGVLAAWLGGQIMLHLQLSQSVVSDGSLIMMGRYLAGLFCLIGHLYPVFYQFRGGKGVAATLGMFFVLDWRIALMCLGLFLVTVAVSRMVSLGSVVAISYLPVLTVVFRSGVDELSTSAVVFCTVLSGLIALIVIFKHGSNMRRIAQGTERRLGQSAAQKKESAENSQKQ